MGELHVYNGRKNEISEIVRIYLISLTNNYIIASNSFQFIFKSSLLNLQILHQHDFSKFEKLGYTRYLNLYKY